MPAPSVSLARDISSLGTKQYDVVVVGAGMFGACAAWDAACRGLRVALVERRDFCSGVSANSYKIAHGGIRYLQHGDIVRLRRSCHERSSLLRIAPHLVHPLPIVIPTFGHGKSGPEFLGAGVYAYDLLTLDRNRGIRDASRHIPFGRLLGPARVRERFPGLPDEGLSGAVQFSDAQIYNPPRLVLAFIQAAASRGADVANYVEATGLCYSGDSVTGIRIRDRLGGNEFELKARSVLLTAGPWTDRLLAGDERVALPEPTTYSRDACFVIRRRFDHDLSLAVMGRTRDPDALMSRPGRHLFVVPWRQYSLIGTWHKVVPADPDAARVTAQELQEFIDEINGAYPALRLTLDDVTACNWGLVPFGEDQSGGEDLSYGKRSLLIDHEQLHGIKNLVSLIGIRVTMGRGDSAQAMAMLARKLGAEPQSPPTHRLPIYGGDIASFEALAEELRRLAPQMDPTVRECLARNHGSEAPALLKRYPAESHRPVPGTTVLIAEILNAVDTEMAMTLADIVLRRTDLATGEIPARETLAYCAELVAERMRWSAADIDSQIDAVYAQAPRFTGGTDGDPQAADPRASITSSNSAS